MTKSTEIKVRQEGMIGLGQKILNVIASIEPVEKDGTNEFHKYKYVTDAQIISSVRGALVKHKLCIIPSQVACIKDNDLTQVEVNYKIVDTETTETMDVTAYGQGMDKGDKGLYKALTGAEKYFFMKTFLIATKDDPEADTKTDQYASRPDYDTPPRATHTPVSKGGGNPPSTKQIGLVMARLKGIGVTTDTDVKAFINNAVGHETLETWKDIDPVLKAIEASSDVPF